jgi:hypothetical protein
LIGRVIASHYAEPVQRLVMARSDLRSAPSDDAGAICDLSPGETFFMLDECVGWAWGYAGPKRRVGYVPSDVLGSA